MRSEDGDAVLGTVKAFEARRDAVSPLPYWLCGFDLIDLEAKRRIARMSRQSQVKVTDEQHPAA